MDTLTYRGAKELAERIFIYWAVRGFVVHPVVEELRTIHRESIYVVRSDLINGHPRA